MAQFVEVSRNGHILEVKLNKPKVNAMWQLWGVATAGMRLLPGWHSLLMFMPVVLTSLDPLIFSHYWKAHLRTGKQHERICMQW